MKGVLVSEMEVNIPVSGNVGCLWHAIENVQIFRETRKMETRFNARLETEEEYKRSCSEWWNGNGIRV
jgi:hypothetical protein